MSTAPRTARKAPAPRGRRLAPLMEAVERREMLDASGVLTGTVFADSNNNGAIDNSDAYLAGARVDLSLSGQSGVVASAVTDANGAYAFNGLAPGTYLLTETPPASYQAELAQAHSGLYPASVLSPTTIQVTVTDGTSVYVKNNGIVNGFSTNNVVNGQSVPNNVGPLAVALGSTAAGSDVNSGFLALCVDDLARLSASGGESFRVFPAALSSLSNNNSASIEPANLGRAAYLFNHYANGSLDSVTGPALQLAVWELVYDKSDDLNLSAGNFQALSPYFQGGDAQFSQVIQQANAYLADSAGKSETALLLDARTPASTDNPEFSQSIIATEAFDFLNARQVTPPPTITSSIAGYVYYDKNNNGLRESGEPPIPGTTVNLYGTDVNGKPVTETTTTDQNGHYEFDNLTPGTYNLHEIQPAAYLDGKTTQGTPGTGTAGDDYISTIVLRGGVHGEDNNFGEILSGKVADETLSSLTLYGIHHQPSTVVLNVSGALDPAQASNPANYTITGLGKDQTYGTRDDYRVPVRAAIYDANAGTVTLVPTRHMNFHYHYLLRANVPATATTGGLHFTEVFGRSSMTVWDYHGRHITPPAMSARELAADQRIANATYARLASGGTGTAAASALAARVRHTVKPVHATVLHAPRVHRGR